MTEDIHSITIEGRQVPLIVRRHPRARRIILRVNTRGEGAVVTIPANAGLAEGLDMVRRQSAWLARRLHEMGRRTAFADGVRIPFRGNDLIVRHRPDGRGAVWREGDEIHVAGGLEHLTRRLADWLKKQARGEIEPLAHAKAATIGKTPARITIRDSRTRWGSCSGRGGLSFSWRLVMAPPGVLDYVVAHEVAHLAHMNHGPDFWRAVDTLTAGAGAGRAWLNDNGAALHRIG